jgi:NTE family protein
MTTSSGRSDMSPVDDDNKGGMSTTRKSLTIGLALSGGGVRAAVFHLGLLGRLAADDLLEQVTFVSTVSGGSLGTGLVYSLSGNRWPTSEEYLSTIAPRARRYLTGKDLQLDAVFRLLTRPWHLFYGRAKLLAESIEHLWDVRGLINELPDEPRWVINATAYESGKNWRFMRKRMGDYKLNQTPEPAFPVASAMAASAAFPILIGPLVLRTKDFAWSRFTGESRHATLPAETEVPSVHLWDGGVYDNLGIEALFKPGGKRYRDEYNFLIVSDASPPLGIERPFPLRRARRLINIAMDQVSSLRARQLVEHFASHPGSGAYMKVGNTAQYILEQAGVDEEEVAAAVSSCLSQKDAELAVAHKTTLRRPSEEEFDRLYRHGWEVADCTLSAYSPDLFRRTGFRPLPAVD